MLEMPAIVGQCVSDKKQLQANERGHLVPESGQSAVNKVST